MQEFFAKYGVRDRAEFDSKVRGDGTFAARVIDDLLEEKFPAVEPEPKPEVEVPTADEAAE